MNDFNNHRESNDRDIWFCTKGYHRFNANDFAYLGQLEDADFAFDLFNNLFAYVYDSKAKLQIGHTAQIGENTFIRFQDISEYNDYLDSPLGTLAIERIEASQINKPDRI